MSQYGQHDVLLEIVKGNVPDHSIMSAMGEFESGNVAAAGEDVCRSEDVSGPGLLPTPAAAGEQMELVSDAIGDSSIGIGVRSVRLHYLDATGAEQTEDVTMNGTTPVTTTATDMRFVNDLYSLTVGATGVAAGNIAVYQAGGSIGSDLYQMIASGGNKSLVPHRMVPLAHKLYLKGWHATEAQSKRCAFRIRSTDMYGVLIPSVFCFKGVAYLNGNASGEMPLDAVVPALSIVKVSYWADAVGAEGSTRWWGVLVED